MWRVRETLHIMCDEWYVGAKKSKSNGTGFQFKDIPSQVIDDEIFSKLDFNSKIQYCKAKGKSEACKFFFKSYQDELRAMKDYKSSSAGTFKEYLTNRMHGLSVDKKAFIAHVALRFFEKNDIRTVPQLLEEYEEQGILSQDEIYRFLLWISQHIKDPPGQYGIIHFFLYQLFYFFEKKTITEVHYDNLLCALFDSIYTRYGKNGDTEEIARVIVDRAVRKDRLTPDIVRMLLHHQ